MRCLRALVIVIHAVAKPRSGVRLYCQMLLRSRTGPFNFTIQFLSGSSSPANHPVACEILATAATVIASQAVITGAYSVASQAAQLGYLPEPVRHQLGW